MAAAPPLEAPLPAPPEGDAGRPQAAAGAANPLDTWCPGHDAPGWDEPGAGIERPYVLDHPEPHRARASRLIKDHPEIRTLFGREPKSAPIVLGIVGAQLALAFLLRDAAWWAVLAVALLFGAFANHALFVLIHECSHNLIFVKKRWNQVFGVICNLPMVVPSAESFRIFHLKHHQYQGDYWLDADLAGEWEARLFRFGFLGKLAWECCFPLAQALRVGRFAKGSKISFWTPGVITNALVIFGFDLAVLLLWGPWALGYMALSLLFSIGPHPLGARWVQEHFVIEKGQETYSYYGPLNRVALNVGYHNEHHDFPFIAWSRLPELRAMAPEAYDCLVSHDSWSKLWVKWLTDPTLTLNSRATRDGQINKRRATRAKETFAPETLDEGVQGAVA